MTKYTQVRQRRGPTPQEQLDPIWRGVGCLLIVIVPVISYILGAATMQIAVDQNWPVPYQLMGVPVLPAALTGNAALSPIVNFLEAQQNLYGILLLALIYVLVLGGILTWAYSVVYKYVGPPRYGPLDAPPPKIAVKRYKR